VLELYPGCNASAIEFHVAPALRPDRILRSQHALLTPAELDQKFGRVSYFAGFVGFMVPYCGAYETGHKLDAVLKQAVELKAAGSRMRPAPRCRNMRSAMACHGADGKRRYAAISGGHCYTAQPRPTCV
jgi:hypothetical protein